MYKISFYGQTDGRTNGRTDGRTDGHTIGQTDGRAGGRTNGRTDGRMDGQADSGQADRQLSQLKAGQTERLTGIQTDSPVQPLLYPISILALSSPNESIFSMTKLQ